MGCSGLLILGLVLNVAHCLEILGVSGRPILEVTHNVTAVLGEDVYLSCVYQGEGEVQSSEWRRQINSKVKSKRLAGFFNDRPFSRDGFSDPESATNLTVKMNVPSVDVEGEYICEFEESEAYSDSVYVTVVARPDIQVHIEAETINGSHYQSVSCSAIGSRPPAHISWLVAGLPPSDYPFTVNVSDTPHSNGTSTSSSVLRFPTHLQDEDSVTCFVKHPTLPNPKLTTVRVETYTRPNVTIQAEMVHEEGSDFWVVSCISSGGRPDTDISLALNMDEELQIKTSTDSVTQLRSVLLPATVYEGHNVTCVFDHPKFTQPVSQSVALPSFYLSVQLLKSEPESSSDDLQDSECVALQEGQSDAVISLQVTGNVPRYNVSCEKDEGLLPDGVELLGSSLTLGGPAGPQHVGLYECLVSYHHLRAALQFNVTLKHPVFQPVPPTVRVDLQTEGGRRLIECSAADAVPAANVSWLLPEGVSGVTWFNFTSHNGSHSVRGVLLLPACLPWELTAECVINHPTFKKPENRSITLPLCARPNITMTTSTQWKDGEKYTQVDCSVNSAAPPATTTWHVGNSDYISDVLETLVAADGSVSVRSSVHVSSFLYSGQNVTCRVEHPSLEAPETRSVGIPVHKAHLLSVSVHRQQDSPFWLAVCDYTGESAGTNLAWVLPENAKSQTSLQSEHEGQTLRARLTYQFPLDLHEGQNLTCVYEFEHGGLEEKTIHIPRYYISAVRVLNRTTPLRSRYGGEAIMHRLSLQEKRHNQKVLLHVEGNVPEYKLDCKREDGYYVLMDGAAMVFPSQITGQDEGLYTCQASFYHHRATVSIQVEIASEDKLFALAAMICISSAIAILLIVATALWVYCRVDDRTPHKEQECLSALTDQMQEPGSPEVKKPAVADNREDKEYSQLISYSIVLDVKSTV
ncbi:uncharacterized protein V6R79_003162 [Siganus canaliculatus]